MLAADTVFLASVCFVVGCNLYFQRRIGDRVAMQWDIAGNPTWSAPKWAALWGILVVMVAVRALIWAAMTFQPEKVHGSEIAVVGFSIIVAGAHLFVLSKSARP